MANVQRLFGVFPEARLGMTRAFPRGEADGVAMREISLGSTELVPCPGDVQLVRTFARMRPYGSVAPTANEAVTYRNAFAFHVFPAKFLLKSCNPSLPNETVIDAGRQIIMPGGDVSVRALVPANWTDEPDEEPEGDWIFELAWSVCPPSCCYPPLPQVTFWANLQIAATDDDRTFKVPPGARRLVLNSAPSGVNRIQWWADQAGGISLGESPIVTNTAIEIVGSAAEIRFDPAPTAAGPVTMKWEIEG